MSERRTQRAVTPIWLPGGSHGRRARRALRRDALAIGLRRARAALERFLTGPLSSLRKGHMSGGDGGKAEGRPARGSSGTRKKKGPPAVRPNHQESRQHHHGGKKNRHFGGLNNRGESSSAGTLGEGAKGNSFIPLGPGLSRVRGSDHQT